MRKAIEFVHSMGCPVINSATAGKAVEVIIFFFIFFVSGQLNEPVTQSRDFARRI
jgi:hypothetical protein